MVKGPSFSDLLDVIKHKTKFSYYCANCNHGPFYTSAARTNCPACDADILLTRTLDGDIIVEVVKKHKRS